MSYYYLALLLPYTRATEAHPTLGRYSFGNDFYPLWLTARECLPQRLDPYSPEVTRKIQSGIFGHVLSAHDPENPSPEYRAFSYPAFADVFALPVAWLPFPAARIWLAALLASLTALSVFRWASGLDGKTDPSVLLILILLTLSSYPGLEALYALQPGLIAGSLLAAAVAALAADQQQWAGCLLAFATIKPQVSLLLTLYLLVWALTSWRERRKFAIAFLVMLLALSFAAMLIWPNWIVRWFQVVRSYPHYSKPPLLPDLFGPYLGGALLVLALATTAGFAWNSRRAPATSLRFGLCLSLLLAVTTVTVLPEHAFYDQIVLLPGIMVVARSWRAFWSRRISRFVLVVAASTLFWPWIAAPAVILAHFVAPGLAAAILFSPLRTAAVIPFAVLGLLFLLIRSEAAGRKLGTGRVSV